MNIKITVYYITISVEMNDVEIKYDIINMKLFDKISITWKEII